MTLLDISVKVAPGVTPTYPGDPGIEVSSWSSIGEGDPANVSVLHFGAHTGTHVDAPAHFMEGAPGLSGLGLDSLVGRARVVEIPGGVRSVGEGELAAADLEGAERVLFKTRNSAFWGEQSGRFREDFTYLEPDAARALASIGVRLVGWDYLSIEKFNSEDFAAHIALLSAGVVIVEGLDLRDVQAGDYELFCLPLRVEAGHGDGAPARAVLRTLG